MNVNFVDKIEKCSKLILYISASVCLQNGFLLQKFYKILQLSPNLAL